MIYGFDDAMDDLLDAANAFDTLQERDGREMSVKDAIERGVTRTLDDRVIDRVRAQATRHVGPDRAMTIRHRSHGWTGDTYHHELGTNNDIVVYHEEGTGGHAPDGRTTDTTYDGRPGYRIYPRDADALAIPASRWRGPSWMLNESNEVIFNSYVVHPGVRGKGFIEDGVKEYEDSVKGYILTEMNRAFREAFDT